MEWPQGGPIVTPVALDAHIVRRGDPVRAKYFASAQPTHRVWVMCALPSRGRLILYVVSWHPSPRGGSSARIRTASTPLGRRWGRTVRRVPSRRFRAVPGQGPPAVGGGSVTGYDASADAFFGPGAHF